MAAKITIAFAVGGLGVLVAFIILLNSPLMDASRVVLSDKESGSVLLASDLDTYRVLLGRQPSLSWRQHYQVFIVGSGADGRFQEDLRALRPPVPGQIVSVPNGTEATVLGEMPLRYLHGRGNSGAYVTKVRIRNGAHKGLEAWTLPEEMTRTSPPIP